jgi:formate C-acetyltransferase
VLFADKVGATPDGRKKGTVLADGGISCSQGKDINGPTALLNSVVKLDPEKAVGSTLLNMKFIPSVFDSLDSQTKIASLLKAYFMMKGQHVQLNVIDVETLRDAQKNPDQYASLVVRVAGFSVLFTTIDPLLQEDIILRTETQSGG